MKRIGLVLVLWSAHFGILKCSSANISRVLMVLFAGNTTDPEGLWNTSPGYNLGSGNKEELSLEEIMAGGHYRSPLVDSWDIWTPETVTLAASDRYGEYLWSVTFDTVGSHYPFWSWLRPERILSGNNDLDVHKNQVSILFNYSNYSLQIARSDNLDLTWFAVERSGNITGTSNTYPIVLYVNNLTHPMSITERNTEGLVNYWFSTPGEMFLVTKDMDNNVEYVIYDSDRFIYLNKIKGYVFFKRYNYTFAYGQDECSSNTRKTYQDPVGHNYMFITDSLLGQGTPINTILLRCLTVTVYMSESSNYLTFTGWGFTDNFLPADALTVVGHYSPESSTSTSSMTTVATSDMTTSEYVTTDGNNAHTTATDSSLTSSPDIQTTEEATTLTSAGPDTTTGSPGQSSSMSTEGSSTSAPEGVQTSEQTTDQSGHTYITSDTSDPTHLSEVTSTTSTVSDSNEQTSVTQERSNTNAYTTSTESSSQQSQTECYCPCPSEDISEAELNDKIETIKKKLVVDPKNLSSYYRRFTSANDQRPSARSIGYLGIIVLSLTLFFIIMLDMTTFIRFASSLKYTYSF